MSEEKKDKKPETAKEFAKVKEQLTCGLVMPISPIDGCTAEHWSEVKNIIIEAVESIGEPRFTVRLVSDADDVGVIQKRIVQNVYSSDIIVCDVSGKNPNVMFELGMRLAFDKATVIIKDDKTDYAFDTGIIEHVPYPRDLRFSRIVTFKAALAEKVLATQRAAKADPSHSTFLKNFGKFQVANLTESVVPADKLTFELLRELQDEMHRMRRELSVPRSRKDPTVALRDPVAGATRIAIAISRYLAKNPSMKPADLIGNREFLDAVESEIGAPRFYMGPDDFRAAVDDVLLTQFLDEANPLLFSKVGLPV